MIPGENSGGSEQQRELIWGEFQRGTWGSNETLLVVNRGGREETFTYCNSNGLAHHPAANFSSQS